MVNPLRREILAPGQAEIAIIGSSSIPSSMMDGLRVGRLFATLDESEYYGLMEQAHCRTIPPGQEVTRQGKTVEFVHFILKGKAKAEIWAQATGRSWAVVDMLGPGDSVGLLSIIDGAPHSATVIAMDQLEIVSVPLGAIQAGLLNHPEWYRILAEEAVSRLRNSGKWLQALL